MPPPERALRPFSVYILAIVIGMVTAALPVTGAADSLVRRSVAEGGLAGATHVVGGYVYVGYANVLVVSEDSDPAAPVKVTDRLFGGDVRDIVSDGGYVYVAASENGVVIFDISDPADPSEVATFDTPGTAAAIAISGGYAFVADETGGLRVLDVNNPAAPVEIGMDTTSANVTDVAVQGAYAYASGEIALLVLDVSTPSSPSVTGSYDLSNNSVAVAVRDDRAYIVHDIHLLSVDVSDKTNPVYVDGALVDGGKRVSLSGDHAFVPGQSGMRIFDISDPMQVTYVSTVSGRQGYDVSIDGTLAYVAYGPGGYSVRDVTDVNDPLVIYDGGLPWLGAEAVAIYGNHAYVAADEGLLKIVDISDADAIVEVGNMEFTPSGPALSVTAVASTGSYAYVAQAPNGAQGVDTEIIDVTDPANPVHAGFFNDPINNVVTHRMEVIGNYLYAAKGLYGLRIYDVSSPLAPTGAGVTFTAGEAYDFAVDGDTIYLLDGAAHLGLKVIDASNFAAMTEIGNFWTPGIARSVALDAANDRLYIADEGNGLIALDINDPTSPTEISTLTAISGPMDVALSGDVAYVTDGTGVHIVDISDPAAPQVVGLFEKTSGGELRVDTRGDDVFVLDRLGGLYSLWNPDVATGIAGSAAAPRAALEQNSPNPFNPSTVIRFEIAETAPVRLNVYDVSGRLVRTLVDEVLASRPSPYSSTWDGTDDNGAAVSSGVYFCQLVVPGHTSARKMVLLK